MDVYLNLHGLGNAGTSVPEAEKPYWLPLERFETVLEIVRKARRRVHITFDDGNISDLRLALPALCRAGLRATFFILSERVGSPHYLGVEDIRALRAEGMAIGSHGADHVRWTSLPDEVLAEQVAHSMAALSEIIGEPVRMIAAPFGAYDRRVLAVLRRLPVDRVHTSDGGLTASWSGLVARNTIKADTPLNNIHDLVSRRHSLLDYFSVIHRQWRWSMC